MKFSRLITFLLFLTSLAAFSQPNNDACVNAGVIAFGIDQFLTGTFIAPENDLTNATIEINEFFHKDLISAGNDKKSIWYRFTLPTARAVKLELKQNGNAIPQGDAGFTTYKTTGCNQLGYPEIEGAKITPLNKFGNSFNPCLDPGIYYVQVSAKSSASGPVSIEITVSPTQAVNSYDLGVNAYDFGLLNTRLRYIDYDLGCQSIEGLSENSCPGLPAEGNYTQSTWHTFTTDNHVDYFSFGFATTQADPDNRYNFRYGNLTLGYRFYKGDIKTQDLSLLTQIGNCDTFSFRGSISNPSLFPRKDFLCKLDPNTTYTIQLLFPKDFKESIRLFLREKGEGVAQGPVPIKSLMKPSNILGTLPHAPEGTVTPITDYLSCESRLTVPTNNCGTLNTLPGVTTGGKLYDLSTWFTFDLDQATNLGFNFISPVHQKSYEAGSPLRIRVFQKGITINCNNVTAADLYKEFTAAYDTLKNFACVPAGSYSVQILGQSSEVDDPDHAGDFMYTNLGQPVTLEISAGTVDQFNKFSLSQAGKFDSIPGYGVLFKPLQDEIKYKGQPDFVGCMSAVLPENFKLCRPEISKAVYRIFNIGDSNNDLVPDSGIVTLTDLNVGTRQSPQFIYRLFKGNANDLAVNQAKFSYPDTISGLVPVSGCLKDPDYRTHFCVIPGAYTLVAGGDEDQAGQKDQPGFQFSSLKSKFYSRATAEDLGDVTEILSVTSQQDVFTCINNAEVIDGVTPCSKATKMMFRQFYLDSAKKVRIEIDPGFYGRFTLFNGKAVNPTSTLKVYSDPESGKWTCLTSKTSPECYPLSKGWYTLVVYGDGSTYEDPLAEEGLIGKANRITIHLYEAPPQSKYNRPYKAYVANKGKALSWPTDSGTVAYPVRNRVYTLGKEIFTCQTDTPFSTHPLQVCDQRFDRVAYYTFSLEQLSYVRITGIDLDRFKVNLFGFDVRTDSLKMLTTAPIQSCFSSPAFSGDAFLQTCGMEPGKYTLVIFADKNSLGLEKGVQPVITVSAVDFSRFDHASNAYDFDLIKGDGLWQSGKSGDINPIDGGRAPSNDFFYCTTGAQETDPKASCNGKVNPNIYPYQTDKVLFGKDDKPIDVSKRNLWYSFVADGPGKVTVRLTNTTPGSSQVSFAVYQSDEDGNIPFDILKKSGRVDSTISQGLSFVANNSTEYYCDKLDTISFAKSQCTNNAKVRYYVLVENEIKGGKEAYSDFQVELSVKFQPVALVPVRYDHYSQANVVNGLDQVMPPYQQTPLDSGMYKGATGSFLCATKDTTDPDCYGKKNLWYKFDVKISGSLRIALEVDGLKTNYNYNTMVLLKEKIKGDSTSVGLDGSTENDCQQLTTISQDGIYWGETCMSPGTYYLLLNDSKKNDGEYYGVEKVRPLIWLQEQQGDLCSKPVEIPLTGATSKAASVNVTCHTIGADFGEDGSNMGCLFGPANYKSTWFRVTVSGSQKVDLSFQLSENTTALSTEIRYRVLYGDCNSMTAGPCNVDALTQFTLNCMSAGSYYVQVVSPENAQGTISLKVTSVISADQNCKPLDPLQPIANFTYSTSCLNDTVHFTNQSTLGENMTYLWKIGQAGLTSTMINPALILPRGTGMITYQVKLKVTNTNNMKTDSIQVPVYVFPAVSEVLGKDTTLCMGDSLLLNATYPSGQYTWNDASHDPVHLVKQSGIYWVDVKTPKCSNRDSIQVSFVDAPKPNLGKDTTICPGDTVRLQVNGTGSFNWEDGSIDLYHTVFKPGIYWVREKLGSCEGVDSIKVDQFVFPKANAGPGLSICFNQAPLLLSGATPSGGAWSGSGIEAGIKFNPASAGLGSHKIIYSVKQGSCNDTASKLIEVTAPLKPAVLNPIGNKNPCKDSAITIHAETQEGASYVWQRNGLSVDSSGPELKVNTPGEYLVLLKNGCGKEQSQVLKLIMTSPEVVQASPAERCGPGAVIVEATGVKAGKYVWYDPTGKELPGEEGSTLILPDVKQNESYSVANVIGTCYGPKSSVSVSILPIPKVHAGENVAVNAGQIVTLHASGASYYAWTSSGKLSDPLIADPVFLADTSTWFYLKGTADNGCSATDSVLVTVLHQITIPNVFSPNEDGLNDVWEIDHLKDYSRCKIWVYNRWGNKVYEAMGYDIPWDGKEHGEQVPVAVYYYRIELGDGSKPFVGNLTIVK